MYSMRPNPRVLRPLCRACRSRHIHAQQPGPGRNYGGQPTEKARQQLWTRSVGIVLAVGVGAAVLNRLGITELHAEAPPAPADLRIEERKPRGLTKEANRDLISPQHLQVKRSWENPGVYAWGSNSGKVVAPDSDETYIKTPRRIPFFDGMLLRDIKLDRNFGAAITEDGDLLQWGTAYSTETRLPTRTLTGKNLASLTISKDRIIALSPSGKIYSIPVSREDQLSGHRPPESTWVPFWSVKSPVAYRTIEPPFRVWYERVSSIASGLEHLLILTSTGRLFTAAASSEDFPSKGQLGIPGLTWTNRSAGRYDQPHEITTLRGFDIRAIAAGDNHSLALDSEGRVFSFGDNISGQLGFDFQPESPTIDAPSLLPTHKLYPGTTKSTRVTSIAAGGNNSFLTVDAAYVPGQSEDSTARRGPERITADTWAFGQGIFGTLGTGRWTHAQGAPTKIKALSGLSEYDEAALSVVPIRLARLSVGSTHASATLANVTHVGAHAASGENDTNWGADVLWWGGNEYYQLGTGKRNNVASPLYIAPLDPAADRDSVARREHRFQATPRRRAQVGGRWVECEQRVECGRFVSAVYSHV